VYHTEQSCYLLELMPPVSIRYWLCKKTVKHAGLVLYVRNELSVEFFGDLDGRIKAFHHGWSHHIQQFAQRSKKQLKYCRKHQVPTTIVLLFFFKIQNTRLFTFFEVSCQKTLKNVESIIQVFTFLQFETANYHFHCKATSLHTCTTRSQAVARIADRTAKNCRGHVT